jgi:hypothetical protein
MMKRAGISLLVGLATLTVSVLAVSGCGSAGSTGTFVPGASGPSAPAATQDAVAGAGAASVVMPPFGKNVHVEMTPWLPSNAAQKQAVIVDKDFELAYLYAEYTGGKDNSWSNYVSNSLVTELQGGLAQPDVTTESFVGTIRFFLMSVTPDPLVHGDLDVSACFDNAESSNTNLETGKVIPDNTPADDHYYRITDQLAEGSGGQWQVIASLPAIYYPRAKECKP